MAFHIASTYLYICFPWSLLAQAIKEPQFSARNMSNTQNPMTHYGGSVDGDYPYIFQPEHCVGCRFP